MVVVNDEFVPMTLRGATVCLQMWMVWFEVGVAVFDFSWVARRPYSRSGGGARKSDSTEYEHGGG